MEEKLNAASRDATRRDESTVTATLFYGVHARYHYRALYLNVRNF